MSPKLSPALRTYDGYTTDLLSKLIRAEWGVRVLVQPENKNLVLLVTFWIILIQEFLFKDQICTLIWMTNLKFKS